MKRSLVLFWCMLLTCSLVAQTNDLAWLNFNETRLSIIRIHAHILCVWALLNIIIGGYLTYILEDGEPESFHHMNAAWNMVNLGVALAMLHTVKYADPANYEYLTSIAKHYQAQKLMLLNIGLDVSYTLAGFLLYEHSKNNKKFDFVLRGFGKSLIFQGLFLLILDLTFYTIHTLQQDELEILLQNATK